MNLPGRLRLTTLGDVFGAVHREGATGVLELTEAHGAFVGRVHRVHFVEGLVADVESPGVPDGMASTAARRARLERIFAIVDARLAFRVARGTSELPSPFDPADFLHGRARARVREGNSGVRRENVRTRALATLGLPDGADAFAVRRAFRQLASHFHPDRFASTAAVDRTDVVRRFAEITAAYHLLTG